MTVVEETNVERAETMPETQNDEAALAAESQEQDVQSASDSGQNAGNGGQNTEEVQLNNALNDPADDDFADVTLDDFELNDLEDAKDAILDLLKKKKKSYKQAKNERLEKEKAIAELNALRSNLKMAETEELAALQAALVEKEAALQAAAQRIEQEQIKQADLMFKHASEIHKAKEAEFLRFKLNEHLKTADLESFDVKEWMGTMKSQHPAMFESEAPVPAQTPKPASSGLPPVPANFTPQTGYSDVAAQRDYTARGKKERDSVWEIVKNSRQG